MLCEKCGKNPATVMYTQIINGHKESINICSECASKESIFDNFGSLLSFAQPSVQRTALCPVCKTTLSQFTRSGRVGCGECYNTFRAQAKEILRKIHGTTVHIKDEEPVCEKEKSEEEILREELGKAIEAEDFEQAAVLRDKIRLIKEGK